jgi:porin
MAISDAPNGKPAEASSVSAEPVHDGIPRQSERAETLPLDVSAVYTAELLGSALGGLRGGTRYLDNLDVTLSIDAERAFGWRGATLFAYGLYNNGKPWSKELVGAAQGVSNIETGVRSARQ